jgi:hypothetical protein
MSKEELQMEEFLHKFGNDDYVHFYLRKTIGGKTPN